MSDEEGKRHLGSVEGIRSSTNFPKIVKSRGAVSPKATATPTGRRDEARPRSRKDHGPDRPPLRSRQRSGGLPQVIGDDLEHLFGPRQTVGNKMTEAKAPANPESPGEETR